MIIDIPVNWCLQSGGQLREPGDSIEFTHSTSDLNCIIWINESGVGAELNKNREEVESLLFAVDDFDSIESARTEVLAVVEGWLKSYAYWK